MASTFPSPKCSVSRSAARASLACVRVVPVARGHPDIASSIAAVPGGPARPSSKRQPIDRRARAIRLSTNSRRSRAATKLRSRSRVAGASGQRTRQAVAEFVDPLRHGREDRLRLRPAANGQIEPLARPLDAASETMLRAVLQLAKLGEQFGTNRVPQSPRRRSASAREDRTRSRSASCRSRAHGGNQRDWRIRRRRERPLPR